MSEIRKQAFAAAKEIIELAGLEGRKLLSKYDVESVITYPGK